MYEREEAVRQLISVGKKMADSSLVWGNSGNLSARLDDEHFVVTASGSDIGSLTERDFVLVDLSLHVVSDGEFGAGRRPSKEVPMHAAIYARNPDSTAVLHASPLYGTLAASSDLMVPTNLFVENMYYLERIARVPYCHPGSHALGEAVRERAADAHVLLLENHGVLVHDTSVGEAFTGLFALELTCQMAMMAIGANLSLRPVPASMVDDFLNRSGYRPRRNGVTS